MMPSVGSMISASTKAYEHAKTRQNGQLRGDQKAMSQMHDQIRALAKVRAWDLDQELADRQAA